MFGSGALFACQNLSEDKNVNLKRTKDWKWRDQFDMSGVAASLETLSGVWSETCPSGGKPAAPDVAWWRNTDRTHLEEGQVLVLLGVGDLQVLQNHIAAGVHLLHFEVVIVQHGHLVARPLAHWKQTQSSLQFLYRPLSGAVSPVTMATQSLRRKDSVLICCKIKIWVRII